MRNSSHVNINEITEYNKNTRRQRPQTGKLRNTALAQQYSSSNVSQGGQQSGGYVVIGPLQSQFNNQHHRRLTSAKQDVRFRQKHYLGGGGPESQLSNTRDVIQSNGYLTTMAGSNIEALSRGKSRRSLAAQATAALPPSQPIVKQHFVPNPAAKRLQSAKGPMMRNQPSLVITNHQSAGRSSPRHQQVVKSGSVATNLTKKAARHSRQRAIAGNQHKTVDTAKDTTGALSDLFHKMQVTTPLPTAKALQASHFQVESDALQQRLDIVDAQSTDAENERQVMTSGSEPLNLAIESTVINNGNFKSKGAGATSTSKMSVNRKRKPSAKARRPAMNRTIYKLPSLSQCIEQKILPRSSEYMRQLYSIALKNHENQVPNMAPRKYDMPEMSPTMTNNQNDTFQLSPDLTQANPAEIQDAAMNLLNAQKVEQAVNQVLNRSSGDQPDKAKGMENRSHSLAQLHKVNLEFPFDSMVHGCFSRQKQMDLNLCPNLHSREPARSTGGDYENRRKRPQTAGRVPAPPNMDLFSNKFISQVANQMSSPQLAAGQELTQKTHEGIFHNDAEHLLAHDSSKALSSALSNHQTAVVNQAERQTTSSVHNQFSNLQSQFANVMDPNKAQIALVVMPQHGQDSNQATIKQMGPSDSNAYFQVLNLNEMPQSEEANQLAGDDEMTQEMMTNKKNYQNLHQERTEDNFSSQLRRSASSRGSKSTHSRQSRQHSAKGKISSYKLARPADLGLNALSQRDSKQQNQRNGTQFAVQISGQAIQGVKITSSRQGESRKAADTPSSSRTGSSNKKKSRQKLKSNVPDVKLSSTHSLKIQMNKTNAKETERSSRNDTNRLDEHDEVDERVNRHGNKNVAGDQFDPNLKSRSRSITGSNQNLEFNEESGQKVRSIYPVTGFQSIPKGKRYSQPNEEAASQQSHSQNLLDTQMRLKQVYQETSENQANRQIHRIPLAQGQQSIGSLPSGPGQDSSRHQVLVVTDAPHKVRQIVMSQDASVSNMSNPLKDLQFSVEKMQPIKIKSVVFDGKGNYQEAERVSVNGQYVESGSIPTALGSPNRNNQNPLFSHQYSPSQRHNTHSHTHANALAQERSKSPNDKKTGDNAEKAPEEGELFNQHKRFVVTQPIKRQSSQRDTSNSRSHVPPRGAAVCQKHYSMKGKVMRLQSADMKHKKHYLQKSRQAKLGSQSNIHVAMVQELLDTQGMMQLDAMMENNQLLALADYTILHNTALNNNYIPPLALPTDSGTEINNSRLPSSRRAHHLDTQGSALGSKQLAVQTYIRSEDSQKILNSFNQNNVRAALRGENATRLMQGLELIEQETQGAENRKSSPERINSLLKHKYATQLHQLSDEGQHTGLTGNLGEPTGESQINLDVFGPIAEHDFAATLQKNQNSQIQLGVGSSLPQNILETKINAQLQMNIQKTTEPEVFESPSPTLNADREDVDSGTVDEAKEVIHEADERSSQHSRIRVSVSSLRKVKQQFTGDLADLSEGVPEPDVLVRKGSQELKKSTIEAPMMSKSGIKSVYEAEEQALKRGIIKAYSGKDTLAGQKRKEQANTDLQHFLLKGKNAKDDSLRISGFSQRKSDNSASQERGRYARSSYKNGTQNKNQRSIDSSRTLNNNTSLKENLNVNTIQKNHRADGNNSPLAITQKSSMGINITRISKKTNLKNRARSTTPTEKNKQLTLQGYQRKAHENMEAARQLINEARVLKLDTEEINKQLLDLFRNKQDTKNLDKMMKQAMKELDDAPGATITSKRRGLEIPYQITYPGQEKKKRAGAGSIMTQQLSSSSHGGKDIQILSIAPSFAPNSPTSTTANQEATVVVRPSITFGLNSVGASTNRASKWELPVFGGIVSSRLGDLVDSKSTIKKIDEGHMQSHDAMRSPQSDHNYLAVAYNDGKQTAQIIDYNQNIMNTVTSHRQQDTNIRKGSFQVSGDDYVKKQPVSSRKNSTKGSKASSQKPQRPFSANRYGRSRFQAPPPVQTAKRNEGYLNTMASDMSSKGMRMHSGPSPKLKTDTNGTFRQMTTIKEDEHLEQPHWATRQNLKSKFNLMSAAQQAQQAQKWLIVADKKPESKSNDRVATAQLQTITSMSPKNAPHTMSQVTTPQNQNAVKYGISAKHIQQQIQIQLQKQRDSPRKIMSMPIQSDDHLDSEQRNYDDQYSVEYAKAQEAQLSGPLPASLSSGNPPAPMFASSNERMMNDQSQQVSLNQNISPNLEDAIDTHRILTRHQKDAVSNASQSHLYEQPMINKYSSNMQLHQNSSKSLVNSRKVIETVQDQGYVKRSRAGEKYFSLSHNMIQGTVGQRKQSHQNQ